MNFSINISKDRYIEILGFTFYSYIKGAITAYSGMQGGRKRSLGEYIESFIYGKVAEEALKLFLYRNGLKTYTELDLNGFLIGVYLPDIILVEHERRIAPLKFWIDVKEIRRDQKWFLLGSYSSLTNRPFDAYVAVWVGLRDEHLAWMFNYIEEIRNQMSSGIHKIIAEIDENVSNIPCEVKGFVTWDDINKILEIVGIINEKEKLNRKARNLISDLNSKFKENGWYYFSESSALASYFEYKNYLFDPETGRKSGSVRDNVGFYVDYLKEVTRDRWQDFFNLILDNTPLVTQVPFRVKTTYRGKPSLRSKPLPEICKLLVPHYKTLNDYRKIYQHCIEKQLRRIGRKRSNLLRSNLSWFSEDIR